MKKSIKRLLVLMFTLVMIIGTFTYRIPYVDAATSHLLIINTKTNKMGYYVNNKMVKEFKIATGKSSSPTPTGKTKIVNKIKNRPYYKLGIPGGSPRNPLGDRWLGLNLKGTYGTTYGIHGNNNESSIGKWVSGGCVRMHNKDIRWLFDRIPNKSDVIIKNTNQSFKQIAAGYGIKVDDSGTSTKTGWQTTNGKTYYLDSKGKKVTGWQTIGNNKYLFNNNGEMQVGWKIIDNIKYYFNSKGIMSTRWQMIGKDKYFFSKEGRMVTGWQIIEGKKYYFSSDGILQTGWKTIGDKKYYFDSTGEMAIWWKTIGKNKYFFSKEGRMVTGWQVIEGKKYYFDSNGVLKN